MNTGKNIENSHFNGFAIQSHIMDGMPGKMFTKIAKICNFDLSSSRPISVKFYILMFRIAHTHTHTAFIANPLFK